MTQVPTASTARPRTLRFRAALAAAKAAQGALRLMHRKGGQLPGVVAEKVCPDFMARIGKPARCVFISGTNGKTTTTNLVDDILMDNGYDPVTNRAGGNIASGIESALIADARPSGLPRRDFAVMELDELSCRTVLPYVAPELMLVTNLYQDNIMRDANPDYIFGVMSAHVSAGTHMVLNGDDLISCRMAPQAGKRTYFSLGKMRVAGAGDGGPFARLAACPECGGKLEYSSHTLLHQGQARCLSCGFTNPEPDYEVMAIDEAASTFTVRENHHAAADGVAPEQTYRIGTYSVPNLYNVLAAVALLRELGLPAADIARSLESGINITSLRYTAETVGGKDLVRLAAKSYNGPGASASLNALRERPGKKALVTVFNDLPARDADKTQFNGWYYLVDGAAFTAPDIEQVIIIAHPEEAVNGRALELRLLLAGVDPAKITVATSPEEAADAVDLERVDGVYATFDVFNGAVARTCMDRVHQRIEEGC